MKINLANYEPERVGGGWTFQRNFAKAMKDNLSDYEKADIYFITSASMVQREEVEKARRDGKKIVLRVDNIIRNSRNRNTGMSRMKDFAEWSDLVVYQSNFAGKLLDDFLKPKNVSVIMNAVDTDIFNTDNRVGSSEQRRYLYSRYSSDETKNWEMARSAFQAAGGDKHLNLVGRFDSNLEEYGFDFYQGESVFSYGLIDDPKRLAEIYKHSDILLYSYFADACSNTLIEALACGLEIGDCYGMLTTGGAPEIMDIALSGSVLGDFDKEYFSLPRMAGEYYEAMAKL